MTHDSQGQVQEEGVCTASMPIDGDKVEYYRVRRGLTRQELANQTGVSYSLISMIENRKCGGSERSAQAIAAALGLTIDDIWRDRKK